MWHHAHQRNCITKYHILTHSFCNGKYDLKLKVKNIEDVIKHVNKLYLQRGFNITPIHADSEFEPLQAEMADIGISLNLTSKKGHVPDIEWFNRMSMNVSGLPEQPFLSNEFLK